MSAPYSKDHYQPLDVFADEALSVGTSVTAFTAATYNATGGVAVAAFCNVQVAPVRVRLTGTDPSATVGDLYNVGDRFVVWGTMDIQSFEAISANGITSTVFVHYAK